MNSEEKFDWFVYIDEQDRHAIPGGYRLENLTEEEALKQAQENLMKWHAFDECEGLLKDTWSDYLNDGEEYIADRQVVTLFRITKEVNVPVMPAIREMEKELERQKKAREEQNERRAREQYERLKARFEGDE